MHYAQMLDKSLYTLIQSKFVDVVDDYDVTNICVVVELFNNIERMLKNDVRVFDED